MLGRHHHCQQHAMKATDIASKLIKLNLFDLKNGTYLLIIKALQLFIK